MLREVTLDAKYTDVDGLVYMSGIQALVRLPMLQRERDRTAQLDTAGFISGHSVIMMMLLKRPQVICRRKTFISCRGLMKILQRHLFGERSR